MKIEKNRLVCSGAINANITVTVTNTNTNTNKKKLKKIEKWKEKKI